jgi:hypothetical protein
MVSVTRPGQRHINIPGIGVTASRRAVGGGNGLLNNLIAYWALDEAAGANNALDLHTNGLTLTQVSSPGSAAGIVYAGARTFDGANDYFTRASESLMQTGSNDFTVAVWAYRVAGGANTTLCRDNSSAQREFNLVVRVGDAGLACYPAGVYTEVNVVASLANNWHLVIGWRDHNAGKIYLSIDNGTPAELACAALSASTAATNIGRIDAVTTAFSGRIGPVAMWKSAAGGGGVLTAAQRTALWNSGAGLAYAAFTT